MTTGSKHSNQKYINNPHTIVRPPVHIKMPGNQFQDELHLALPTNQFQDDVQPTAANKSVSRCVAFCCNKHKYNIQSMTKGIVSASKDICKWDMY